MADPDAQAAPKPPPNLRVADDENRECDNCSHYQRGKCVLYSSLPVDGEWVCDSWEKGTAQGDDAPFKGKNLSEAEAEARIRVREHTRGRAQGKQNT
jgi:hypothetical protein